jgi:hypothetical protein
VKETTTAGRDRLVVVGTGAKKAAELVVASTEARQSMSAKGVVISGE